MPTFRPAENEGDGTNADPGFVRASAYIAILKAHREAMKKRTEEVKKAISYDRQFVQEIEKATQRNKTLAAQLRDGSYARHARDIGALTREYDRLQRTAQVTALVAQHGRLGAAVRLNAQQYQTLGRTALYGVAGAALLGRSLVSAGLQGTVEGYRLEYAWTRLSRQIAGVAVPAVNKVAEVVGGAASWFQAMSRSTQDTVLNLGLVAVGATVAAGALRTLVTVGGAAMAVGRGLGMVFGSAGAAGAAAAGGGAAGALGTGAGSAVAGAGVAGAAAAGGRGMLARAGAFALKRVLPVAAAGFAGYEALTGGHYEAARARGQNKFTAGATAVAGGIADTLTNGYYGESQRRKREGEAAPGAHRNRSELKLDEMEIGGLHARIQEEVLKVSAAEQERFQTVPKEMVESVKRIEAMVEGAIKQQESMFDAMQLRGATGSLSDMLRRGR